MKKVDATYNENTDGFTPVAEGTYPAHVSGFESNEYQGSQVFNLTFTVAEEASKLEIPKLAKDNNGNYVPTTNGNGEPATVNASFVAGNSYRVDKGVWLTPNPDEGEGWKNRRYKEFFEGLGIEFPTDKEGNTTLAEVEEDDVLGFPCLIELRESTFTNSEGKERTSLKVTNVHSWDDGTRLSAEELSSDVPF